MNCLEFRRAVGTAPHHLDEDALAHRAACPRCNEALERALVFERSLAAAVAIPVPDNLAERILLRQTTAALHAPRAPLRSWWSIAAAGVLGIALAALFGWRWWSANATLADLAIAHLAHEPFALSARAEVDEDAVRAMFASLGAPVARSPGTVHYLNDCRLGERMSLHMVLQRDSGPVTAMYVPRLHEPRRDFESVGVRGRETPVGAGTLILLAADAREFDAIESQFRRAFAGGDGAAFGAP